MAKYEVLERSFINNRLHDAGSIIEYDGVPAENLKPVDTSAKAAAKAAAASGEPLNIIESAPKDGEASGDGGSSGEASGN
jgi:hypothetical protein